MATKRTRTAVTKAKIRAGNIFKFRKFPIWPPIKTTANKYQQLIASDKTSFLVNCPIIPEIELIKMNNEADVTTCLGLAALIKNNIGLKKIPPPIPTTPEINPKVPPIKIESGAGICL